MDVNELAKHLQTGPISPADLAAVVPDGTSLKSLERFHECPNRHRGVYVTNHIDSFATYVAAYAAPETSALFIDTEALKVIAVLDYGNDEQPLWKTNLATFIGEPAPIVKAVKALEKLGRVSQDAMVAFIDDWGPKVSFRRGETVVPTVEARRLFSDLTVEKVRQLKSNVTKAFERERSAAETLSMGAQLPDRMILMAEPIKGVGEYEINVNLSAAESGAEAAIRVQVLGWALLQEQVGEALSFLVDQELSTYQRFVGAYESKQES